MPTAWITQCPKEVTPNAIFGMCPKSLCSGTTCQVYRFKGHLYCDHGFTDNEDAHKGLNFLFTSHLPKDSKKVEERIINFFPVTAMKTCYRIQDSAKIYCPKAVQHTTDSPVFIFDGNFYCVHGYTSLWATNPEKISSGSPSKNCQTTGYKKMRKCLGNLSLNRVGLIPLMIVKLNWLR